MTDELIANIDKRMEKWRDNDGDALWDLWDDVERADLFRAVIACYTSEIRENI